MPRRANEESLAPRLECSLIGGDDTAKIRTYPTCVPSSHSSNVWQKESVELMQTEYLAKPDRRNFLDTL